MVTFDFFGGNVKNTKKIGEITLEQFIKSNTNPKPNIQKVFKEIEEATARCDLKRKSELKQNNLFFFTPSVRTDGKGRSYTNIIDFNPLIPLDFDGLDKTTAKNLKEHLFNNFKCCVSSYLSPSKHGVKALFKLSEKPQSVDDFKAFGAGIANTFEWYKGFDTSSITNPVLPLFLSWDDEMLSRNYSEAEGWSKKGFKETLFEPFEGEIPDSSSFDEEEIQKVYDTIRFYIERIDGNGHPQVYKTSCIAGSVSRYMGLDLLPYLEQLIEENKYLQKDVVGYKRTARQMFCYGMRNPQPLRKTK